MPDAPRAEVEPDTESVWFGGEILAADLGAILVSATGTGAAIGIPLYFVGGPAIHWGNHSGKGWGSFGLRAGLPLGLGFAGAGLADRQNKLEGFAVGMLLGAVTAITIDVAALAYVDVPLERRTVRIPPSKLRVAPTLAVTPNGAFTGVVGMF
ncbi:MAG: hypothetical protein R3B13_11515 [Polyangiaceae bacterium]